MAGTLTFLFAAFSALPVAAQVSGSIDIQKLTTLYSRRITAQEANKDTAVLEEQIATERVRLHRLVEEELRSSVQLDQGDIEAVADLESAVDRQAALVETLNDRANERRADLAVLEREVEAYRRDGPDAMKDRISVTESYPNALAQTALVEEKLDVLNQVIDVQNQRLEELKSEQGAQRFRAILSILQYLLIILAVFWFERFIRTLVLMRVPFRALRYGLSKTFTFVVYFTLLFWLIQEVFAENPTMLAALAVAGAALVVVMQDVLKGVVGWMIHRETLILGRRVTIGNITGDVVDRGFLQTTLLMTKMGDTTDPAVKDKIVVVPNVYLLTHPVVSLHSTSDYIRVELTIAIADTRQWKLAKSILQRTLAELTGADEERLQRQMRHRMRTFLIDQPPLGIAVFTEIHDGAVEFTLCFPALIGKRRSVVTAVSETILERFAEKRIKILGMKDPELETFKKEASDDVNQEG